MKTIFKMAVYVIVWVLVFVTMEQVLGVKSFPVYATVGGIFGAVGVGII